MEAGRSIVSTSEPSFSIIPTPILSEEQLCHCSKAITALKQKLLSHDKIKKEFSALQHQSISAMDVERRCSVALESVNCKMNRFTDVLPFNENRIVLKRGGESLSGSGYINASPITAWEGEGVSKFIATQAPMKHTYGHFWEMVYENRAQIVIMLTESVDKCGAEGDYFHTEGGVREFGNVCIQMKTVECTENFLFLRRLHVYPKGAPLKGGIGVLHIQYSEWPDYGVPEDSRAIREIFRVSRDAEGPIVVHCRAGIGRTGTYCIIHTTIQRILLGDLFALDLSHAVSTLRSQRPRMVQTMDQFLLCYKAVMEELDEMILHSSAPHVDNPL